MKFERILVAVEFSSHDRATVEMAVSLAAPLSASLTVFHAFEPQTFLHSMVPGTDSALDEESVRTMSEGLLATIREGLLGRGVADVRTVACAGYPQKALLGFAMEGKFDLVVMGMHGKSGWGRLWTGSVSEAVVGRMACPVVLVPSSSHHP